MVRSVAVPLLAALVLAGCTVEVGLEVEESGRGRVTTLFLLTPEEAGLLRQLANLPGYADAWRRTLERRGMRMEEFDLEKGRIVLVRTFSDPRELQQVVPGTGSGSWVSVEREAAPFGDTWTVTAKVDTRQLLPSGQSVDPAVRGELDRRLRAGVVIFRVRLPGEVVSPEAKAGGQGGEISWTVPIGEVAVVRAESRVQRVIVRRVFWGVVAGATLLMVVSVLRVGVALAVLRREAPEG